MSFVNEAAWDRIIRVAIGVVLLYLGWSGVVEGGWGTFLKIFGFFPLATGLSGFCVLYTPFRVSTNGKTYKTRETVRAA